MRVFVLRRAALLALTTLVALSAVAPVEARSPIQKIEPRRIVPYRVGHAFTPDTDVLSVSGYAAWMIDEALGRTTPLPRLGAAFLRAEREEGINARYLVAHAILETRWGTSDIARLKRNLFGYSAFDRDPWRYATRFRTYQQGILAVARTIKEKYLSPTGRWWYGFTTLRGMNRYYASDPRWADKIAVLANEIDALVVTLRERCLRFGRPAFGDTPVARGKVSLDVPWRARPGAVLPKAIRFAVRWTPVALVESAATGPEKAPTPRWTLVKRTDRPGRTVRLALRAPSQPGVWRVEIEARDSDGRPLPKTDRPRIRSLIVRVAGPREADLRIALGRDGRLAATVANIGRQPIAAARGEMPTTLEAWALPLDPARNAYRLAAVDLGTGLAVDLSRVIRLPDPAVPAVVVVRLSGDPAAIGRTRPVAVLVRRGSGTRLVATALPIAGAADERLLRHKPTDGRITLGALDDPGTLVATAEGGTPAPEMGDALAAAEDAPGRPWLLVRSLAAESGRSAAPSRALVELPHEPPSPARVEVTGLPAGIRLVMAGIVPPDGGPADPATLRLAWIPVAALAAAGADPD